MHFFTLSFALLPLATRATNVVLSNDDGWAEINIRTFYSTLTAAGDSVVLSAPAENESGTGLQNCHITSIKGAVLMMNDQVLQTRQQRRSQSPASMTLVLLGLRPKATMRPTHISIMSTLTLLRRCAMVSRRCLPSSLGARQISRWRVLTWEVGSPNCATRQCI